MAAAMAVVAEAETTTYAWDGVSAACRVEFGADGLTDAQLNQIRWMVGGKANHVQVGESGELVPYTPGLILMIK